MKLTTSLALAAYWAIGAVAIPTAPKLGPLQVFHNLPKLPPQWTIHGPADKTTKVKAQIDSPNYGKWLSKEEVDAFTAPPKENVKAVKDWLNSSSISKVSQPTSNWIEFVVPISAMESLLDAKYELFNHHTLGRPVPATTKYSVPKGLHGIIDLVTPTTAFYQNMGPTLQTSPVEERVDVVLENRQPCNTNAITPSCINSLYNVDYTSKGSATAASTLFINVAASHSDYQSLRSKYTSGLQDFQYVSIAGGYNPGSGDQNTLLEGNLDTQYIGGVAAPNPSQLLAAGPNGQEFEDQMANFASYLNSASNPPSTVSGSTGGGFSNRFSTPSYQQDDVTAYEKFDGNRANGYFNKNGRGYPDISLVSLNFQVITNGQTLNVLGTSASSPSWAALVSVLNDYRKQQGKPNLGFINPLLYSAKGKSGLRDITSGRNPGCGLQGFPATGLGVLDFAKMRAVV
ncbi:hypothetical protein NLG97_g4520 [Lecanicillium saksenae]|uniref:Uncharacterized protein n=1 Tax=Lecanicillium saksenae TaxID=468837 RepID=A0ACC1QV44_9HYPO|nr:hypothetical protein NLG97_g4520 [Lecanicillium saksenae]